MCNKKCKLFIFLYASKPVIIFLLKMGLFALILSEVLEYFFYFVIFNKHYSKLINKRPIVALNRSAE